MKQYFEMEGGNNRNDYWRIEKKQFLLEKFRENVNKKNNDIVKLEILKLNT